MHLCITEQKITQQKFLINFWNTPGYVVDVHITKSIFLDQSYTLKDF